jgi:hypothetical protein
VRALDIVDPKYRRGFVFDDAGDLKYGESRFE